MYSELVEIIESLMKMHKTSMGLLRTALQSCANLEARVEVLEKGVLGVGQSVITTSQAADADIQTLHTRILELKRRLESIESKP